MSKQSDLERCIKYLDKAHDLVNKAQDIFDKYDIPCSGACPGDASCHIDEAYNAVISYMGDE